MQAKSKGKEPQSAKNKGPAPESVQTVKGADSSTQYPFLADNGIGYFDEPAEILDIGKYADYMPIEHIGESLSQAICTSANKKWLRSGA